MPNARKLEWAIASICRALESEELVTDETLEIMEKFVKSHASSDKLDLRAYPDLSIINKSLHNLPTTKPLPETIAKAELMLARFSEFLAELKNTRMQHESTFLSKSKLLEQHESHSTK